VGSQGMLQVEEHSGGGGSSQRALISLYYFFPTSEAGEFMCYDYCLSLERCIILALATRLRKKKVTKWMKTEEKIFPSFVDHENYRYHEMVNISPCLLPGMNNFQISELLVMFVTL